ncbi:alpha/beta hydrolase [Escherichia coli]
MDHRVAAFGFRFGANVAVRLAYLESPRLKAVAVWSVVIPCRVILSASNRCRKCILTFCESFGMHDASDEALRVELNRDSLKVQGLLGRRCPTPMLSGYWEKRSVQPGERRLTLIDLIICDGKIIRDPI